MQTFLMGKEFEDDSAKDSQPKGLELLTKLFFLSSSLSAVLGGGRGPFKSLRIQTRTQVVSKKAPGFLIRNQFS